MHRSLGWGIDQGQDSGAETLPHPVGREMEEEERL